MSTVPTATAATLAPLHRPPRLCAGDTVVVVSPSGPVPEDRLRLGVERLESWGLQVRLGEHVLDRGPFDYLAGVDEHRCGDLYAALTDGQVAGVVCARGGYGADRIVDTIDWTSLTTLAPKVFVGYSDITVLHEAMAQRLGWVSVHGPMVGTEVMIDHDDTGGEHLRRTLLEPESTMVLRGPDARTLVSGRAQGVTVGGCASLLAGAVGTATWRTSTPGGIVLLEDVGEELYRVDGMLTRLRRSGFFDGVTGVVLGSWKDCAPVEQIERLVLDRLGDLGVPILSELGFGHGAHPLTVPLGVAVELDADAGTLTLLEPALS